MNATFYDRHGIAYTTAGGALGYEGGGAGNPDPSAEISAANPQFHEVFGKYLSSGQDLSQKRRQEEEKKERARNANRILRTMYRSAGLTVPLLNDFRLWSEYVQGFLSRDEFIARVRDQVSRKAAALKN